MPFVLQMLATTHAPSADAARASNAMALFMALVFLLGIFMTGIILLWAARRLRRLPPPDETVDQTSPDPWHEAARRIEPPPREHTAE